MSTLLNRRALLGAALGAAAQATLVPRAFAAARAAGPRVEQLTPRLTVIAGLGANVLAHATEEGVLLVDTGAAAHRSALRAQLRRLPGKGRVHTVINTHWHRDQVGANEMFGKAGAAIVAHVKTRQRLSVPLWQPEAGRYLDPLPKAAWPTRTFRQQEALEAGGAKAECGYLLEAHTDGDIYVRFPEDNVIAVGDVLAAPDRDPELDWYGGGWLGGRVDALALLLELSDESTRIVPSQGPVVGRQALQAEHDMLEALFDELAGMMRKGFTTRDMIDSGVLGTTGREWKDGDRFLYSAHKGLWAHHNTLSHDIV